MLLRLRNQPIRIKSGCQNRSCTEAALNQWKTTAVGAQGGCTFPYWPFLHCTHFYLRIFHSPWLRRRGPSPFSFSFLATTTAFGSAPSFPFIWFSHCHSIPSRHTTIFVRNKHKNIRPLNHADCRTQLLPILLLYYLYIYIYIYIYII